MILNSSTLLSVAMVHAVGSLQRDPVVVVESDLAKRMGEPDCPTTWGVLHAAGQFAAPYLEPTAASVRVANLIYINPVPAQAQRRYGLVLVESNCRSTGCLRKKHPPALKR